MPAYGVGVDVSTHRVHMALVDHHDELLDRRIVVLDGKDGPGKLTALMVAFHEMRRELPGTVVIERPFLGENDNEQTPIVLSLVVGMIESAAYIEGYAVLLLTANEWRSYAGIHLGKRASLKAEALRLYRLQFSIETKDDNEAEAALMALVACRKGRVEGLIAAQQPRDPKHGHPKAWQRAEIDEDVPA